PMTASGRELVPFVANEMLRSSARGRLRGRRNHPMRMKTTLALIAGLVLWAASSLLVPCAFAQTWTLPQGTAVKDSGPRTYRFIVDYNTANTKGEMVFRQRLSGEYTRGLAGGDVMWKNVTQADAAGATAPFSTPQKRDFMEGFRYRNNVGSTMSPEFFKGFPPTAMMERNLVW